MAKSKLVKWSAEIEKTVMDTYKWVEDAAVGTYQKMEDAVVGGYQKIEDAFVEQYLTKEGETIGEAKQRLKQK